MTVVAAASIMSEKRRLFLLRHGKSDRGDASLVDFDRPLAPRGLRSAEEIGRYLAGRKFLGWGRPTAFDDYYDRRFRAANLSAFQRSYAFVLAHGLDAVNADMQTAPHLHENLVAAATSQSHFA